jgi:hypothetical protein
MEMELVIGWIGFLMAVYSVMGNDAPAQVLGTLIASHPNKKWVLWLGSSALLVAALLYSWFNYGGGIAFDRLDKIPYRPIEWYYLLGPIGLLILTRYGVPVSTSFMMLSMFSAGIVLEKIIIKSMVGYGLAFCVALIVWLVVSKSMNAYLAKRAQPNMRFWRPLQYLTTGTLWWFWLSHDLANIAVFLPRVISVTELIIICVISVAALGYIFRQSGGRVHKFVFSGDQDMDIRVATLIDAIYAFLLFVFKEWNSLPMSTTWVFVGLMGGRAIGHAIWDKTMPDAVKTVAVRLGMLTFGAVVSLGLVGVVMLLK